ncbi:ParB N-terminal domain-containing protein [uncultured Tateyamaria sp.]|uniref:ParB/RepB/Spo0J family partition protein n=1 Tax=uncultured Tateyamaria sp. TaxID=455651 RepID=UPI00262047D6|nr:ParB N-terminal domain-containing protein [uncultured Tateyamaria sp.]
MAKRKRLSPANPDVFGAAPETKSMLARAPIADVASDAATTAALHDVSRELSEARATGRMVLSLPVSAITLDHIVRDRVAVDDAEMEALMASIAARGQQSPIEVLETGSGQYGLISGWRRCQAIVQLAARGDHDGTVLALLRRPSDASETYQAMVEENEIRVGLSYYERARIAARAVEQGVFETQKAALLTLFATASRPKRSKIRSFLPLVAALDGHLRFPHAIGERLGLKISAALETHKGMGEQMRTALAKDAPDSPEAEQALLAQLLTQTAPPSEIPSKPRVVHQNLAKNLQISWDEDGDWLRLSGPDMTPALRDQIIAQIRKLGRR